MTWPPLVVKAALGAHLRRVAVERTTLTFSSLLAVLESVFHTPVAVRYHDDDGDLIGIGSTPELEAALVSCGNLLRLSLVAGNDETEENDAPSMTLSDSLILRTPSAGADTESFGRRAGRWRSGGGEFDVRISKRPRGKSSTAEIAVRVEGTCSMEGKGENGEVAFDAKRRRLGAGEENGGADEVIDLDAEEDVIDLDALGDEQRREPVAARSKRTGGGSGDMTLVRECAEASSARDVEARRGGISGGENASLAAGSGGLSISPTLPLARAPLGSAVRLDGAKRSNVVDHGRLVIDGEGGRCYGKSGTVAVEEAGDGKVEKDIENLGKVKTTTAPSIELSLTDPVIADAQTALTPDSCLDIAPKPVTEIRAKRKGRRGSMSIWSPKLHAMFITHVEKHGIADPSLQDFRTAHAPERSMASLRSRAHVFGYSVKKGWRNPSQPRKKKIVKKAKKARKAKKKASVASKPLPSPIQPSSSTLRPSLPPAPAPATSDAVVYPSAACPSADPEAPTHVDPSSSPVPSVAASDAVIFPAVVSLSADFEIPTPVETASTSARDADCGFAGAFELLDDEAMAKLAESILAAEAKDVDGASDEYFEAEVLGLSQRVCFPKMEEELVVGEGEPEPPRRAVGIEHVSFPAFQKSADASVATTAYPKPRLGSHFIPSSGQSSADEGRNVFPNKREDRKELPEASKIGAAGVEMMVSTSLAPDLLLAAPKSRFRIDASLDSLACSSTLATIADQPGGGDDGESDHKREGACDDDGSSGGGVKGSKMPPQFRGDLVTSLNSALVFVSSLNNTSSSAEEADVSQVLPSPNAKLVDGAREVDATQCGSATLSKTGHTSRTHRGSDKEASPVAIGCKRLGSAKVVLCDDQLQKASASCGLDIDGSGCLSPISATEVDQEVERGTAGQSMSNSVREKQSSSLIIAVPGCCAVSHAPQVVHETGKYSGPDSGEAGELGSARIIDGETEGIAGSGSDTLEAASQAPVAGLLANQLQERRDSGIDSESRGSASCSTLRSRDERIVSVLPGPFPLLGLDLQPAPVGRSSSFTQNTHGRSSTALPAEARGNGTILGSKPSVWDACARLVAGEMPESDRAGFLLLKRNVFAMSNFMLSWFPACLLVNALPYVHGNDAEHCQRRETELKNKLQDCFRDLNVFGVKTLDSEFRHALVFLPSQADYSILLPSRQSSRRLPMQAGLGNKACLRTITNNALSVNLSTYGGDVTKALVLSDLSLLSKSARGHFAANSTVRRDTFSVVGDAFNVLMIIALVGRNGRRGFRLCHQIC